MVFLYLQFFQQLGGSGGVDMSKFPEFKFEEPKLDPINLEAKWTNSDHPEQQQHQQ